MPLVSLSDWLTWIGGQHRKAIDLDLGRVSSVAATLSLTEMTCPLVTVGGTNGKGSTVAGLEALWLEGGFRVGAFTSPWLYHFNELIRVQGQPVSDALLVSAFAQIEAARGDVTLTVFEFNTLAALLIFKAAKLDVVILEVGLGGRLDAVNILSPDVAVVTSIALDHMDWLGDTREAIGGEKAGIFRAGQPAVCGDPNPPASLRVSGVPLWIQGQDFGFERQAETWTFWSGNTRLEALPVPALLLQNMACVLQVTELLQGKLPLSTEAIQAGLQKLHLPGRIEVRPGPVTEIRDVSHNPAAVQPLTAWLQTHRVSGKTRAVFSMLADKDIVGTLRVIMQDVDAWFAAPLASERAADVARLQADFKQANIADVHFHESVQSAYLEAKSQSLPGDRIVVFGSFYTLSAVGNDA